MAINRALKIAIAISGRKQKDVARKAGMDQWRFSRILHGDIAPSPVERRRIARALGAAESDFWGGAVVTEAQP